MSIEHCHDCDKYIDIDFDAEHFDEHQEDRYRALFGKLTGDNPEDVLGQDWQAIMRDYLESRYVTSCHRASEYRGE